MGGENACPDLQARYTRFILKIMAGPHSIVSFLPTIGEAMRGDLWNGTGRNEAILDGTYGASRRMKVQLENPFVFSA
jgi:hypothetical protein